MVLGVPKCPFFWVGGGEDRVVLFQSLLHRGIHNKNVHEVPGRRVTWRELLSKDMVIEKGSYSIHRHNIILMLTFFFDDTLLFQNSEKQERKFQFSYTRSDLETRKITNLQINRIRVNAKSLHILLKQNFWCTECLIRLVHFYVASRYKKPDMTFWP